jgi:hypothetical protein
MPDRTSSSLASGRQPGITQIGWLGFPDRHDAARETIRWQCLDITVIAAAFVSPNSSLLRIGSTPFHQLGHKGCCTNTAIPSTT